MLEARRRALSIVPFSLLARRMISDVAGLTAPEFNVKEVRVRSSHLKLSSIPGMFTTNFYLRRIGDYLMGHGNKSKSPMVHLLRKLEELLSIGFVWPRLSSRLLLW